MIACFVVLSLWAPLSTSGGSGAAIAALLGGEHGHRISVETDRGHDDIVFCHDAPDAAPASAVAIRASDCADDHRVHVASADHFVSRGEMKLVARVEAWAPLATVADPSPRVSTLAAAPADALALCAAVARQRTIVLQV